MAGYIVLTRVLGVGAYGVVYTAVDIHTNEVYAVKVLCKEVSFWAILHNDIGTIHGIHDAD
jgi:serine/threonine protein kinase